MIANATPLIYLAKVGKLFWLKDFFGKVYIPKAVQREVVEQGKELHEPDAFLVERAIAEGWIVVKAVEPTALLKDLGIDEGETEAISLALEMKRKEILMDQTHARVAAELLGLTPRGTLYLLLLALKEGKINYAEFRSLLEELIRVGFRLSEEVYLNVLKAAEEVKKKNNY